MARIGMLGAGSWGTALTYELSSKGHQVVVWSVSEDEVRLLNEQHEQKVKLPGVKLPAEVQATTDLQKAIDGMDLLVLAVPSPFTRSTARSMQPYVAEGQLIVSVAKGIEEDSLMTLTQIIEEEIPQCRTAVLCGPTHAEEVGKGLPTAIVAGAVRREDARYVQDIFMSEVFRVYTSPDVLGMQVGAALKNVVALAAGIADGLGYGDNTKAALITRGIAEIARLGLAMGGRLELHRADRHRRPHCHLRLDAFQKPQGGHPDRAGKESGGSHAGGAAGRGGRLQRPSGAPAGGQVRRRNAHHRPGLPDPGGRQESGGGSP